jgi:hypothetical protein
MTSAPWGLLQMGTTPGTSAAVVCAVAVSLRANAAKSPEGYLLGSARSSSGFNIMLVRRCLRLNSEQALDVEMHRRPCLSVTHCNRGFMGSRFHNPVIASGCTDAAGIADSWCSSRAIWTSASSRSKDVQSASNNGIRSSGAEL